MNKKPWHTKSAYFVFMKDFAEYNRQVKKDNNIRYEKAKEITTHARRGDIWYMNQNNMPIKECTRLNRLLGLHKINK